MFLQNPKFGKRKNQLFRKIQTIVDLKYIKKEKLIMIKKQKQLNDENPMIFLEKCLMQNKF